MKTFIFLILASTIVGCNVVENGHQEHPIQGVWGLDSVLYENEVNYPPDYSEGNVIQLNFQESDEVYLEGYCNTGSAHYRIDDRIEFSDVSLTEKACPYGLEWEDYIYQLIHITEFELKTDTLR